MAMMTVKTAAERMGISDSLVYELCAGGSLPPARIDRSGSLGCIRDTDADLLRYQREGLLRSR